MSYENYTENTGSADEKIRSVGQIKDQIPKKEPPQKKKKKHSGRSIAVEAFLLVIGILGILLGVFRDERSLTIIGIILAVLSVLFIIADISAYRRRR